MQVMEILIRSFSGYLFVVLGLILYFWYLHSTGRKQTQLHIAAVFVFCYYLIGVFTMTGMGKLHAFAPKIVLTPFLDMIRGPVDTVLNVILFVPLGFFLPLLYQKFTRLGPVALAGFLLSLSIECFQMFGRGFTDINDLITNTAGACLGYFVYCLLPKQAYGKLREKLWASHIREEAELLFFVACAYAAMVVLQPLVIHNLFHLG